jgi:hypothetical protein
LRSNAAVALDTNILLLWLVAETDSSLLQTFKRVQIFDEQDIPLLQDILRPFSTLVTTPHVLAETSNFIQQAPSHRRSDLAETLRRYVDNYNERYEAARSLSTRAEFMWLGLSDTGLSSLSTELTIVTADTRLTGEIESLGGSVINFNRARTARLLQSA